MEKHLHDTEKMASVELNDLRNHDSELPPPAIAHHQQEPRTRAKLSATTIIPVWIVLSSGVIIYNNYIYNTLHFKYPVFLVTWHLTFAVGCFDCFFILEFFLCFFFFFFFRPRYLPVCHIHSYTFQAIGTRVLQRTTHLLDGARDVPVSKDMFLRSILPIGLLFSGSLILSNTAYLYLSVAYIQMLKVR